LSYCDYHGVKKSGEGWIFQRSFLGCKNASKIFVALQNFKVGNSDPIHLVNLDFISDFEFGVVDNWNYKVHVVIYAYSLVGRGRERKEKSSFFMGFSLGTRKFRLSFVDTAFRKTPYFC
jgi:hypothetical protein